MNIAFGMQVLNSVKDLQADHQNSLQSKAPSTSVSQDLRIFSQFVKEQVAVLLIFMNVLKLGESLRIGVFKNNIVHIQLIIEVFSLKGTEFFTDEVLFLVVFCYLLHSLYRLMLCLFQNVCQEISLFYHFILMSKLYHFIQNYI